MTRIIATDATVDLVRRRGGCLWVWTRASRCCGGGIGLESATEVLPGREFQVVAREPFEVQLAAVYPPPEELHVDVSRRGRLNAYWNGCAWVI